MSAAVDPGVAAVAIDACAVASATVIAISVDTVDGLQPALLSVSGEGGL